MNQLSILPLTGMGEITPNTDLADTILQALTHNKLELFTNDIIVITQKIVSKAEGALIDLATITPSSYAKKLAKTGKKSAAYYEVVLSETKRIVRANHGIIICETHHGFICANAGVDESNIPRPGMVAILPKNPDQSALAIRKRLLTKTGKMVAVLISDTWGRTWRVGQTNMAIGVAGIPPLISYRGKKDAYGYTLSATEIAVADELCAAGELVMNKSDGVPFALIRGYQFTPSEASIRELIMDPKKDLFR